MPTTQKIERVNAANIVIKYNNVWYALPLSDLVAIDAVQKQYGLYPTQGDFIRLNLLTPVTLTDSQGKLTDEVIYPEVPTLDATTTETARIAMLRDRFSKLFTEVFDNLKAVIDLNPTEFTTILADNILP